MRSAAAELAPVPPLPIALPPLPLGPPTAIAPMLRRTGNTVAAGSGCVLDDGEVDDPDECYYRTKLCYLKTGGGNKQSSGQSYAQCSDYDPTSTKTDKCGPMSAFYSMWAVGPHDDLHWQDPSWHGASGPVSCPPPPPPPSPRARPPPPRRASPLPASPIHAIPPRRHSPSPPPDRPPSARQKSCGNVETESVQSVAVTHVSGFPDAIVMAASPSRWDHAAGTLSFWNARTLEFITCQPAGIKPEGIKSFSPASGSGMVASINEGSPGAIEEEMRDVGPGGHKRGIGGNQRTVTKPLSLDHAGSFTLCDVAGGVASDINCYTYTMEQSNWEGAMKTAHEYREAGVRLYGPSGDSVKHDLEPEGGDFTSDGKYFIVNLQDNNGYLVFDIEKKKYISLAAYPLLDAHMDASDKDKKINIKDKWGSDNVGAVKLLTPDVAISYTEGGVHYFITANEGDTRDGEDMLGIYGEFEGEEIRMKDLPCTCSDCCDSKELGRLLTTPFLPSDYATNACGTNLCDAAALDAGLSSDFKCYYPNVDYGKGDSIDGITHRTCEGNFATLVAVWYDRATNAAGQAYNVKPWYPSDDGGVDASMTSVDDCAAKCQAKSTCTNWYYEHENGFHECFLKTNDGLPLVCQTYVQHKQHYVKGASWTGYSGPKPSDCVAPAPYTSVPKPGVMTGSPGGTVAIGGRSWSLFKFDPTLATPLSLVYDSGAEIEELMAKPNNNLCAGCTAEDATISSGPHRGEKCTDFCPFGTDGYKGNSLMDQRSDAKGAEPECIETGITSDGKRLVFVGLERYGGIVTYEVPRSGTSPVPVQQDFLNVRNWAVDMGKKSVENCKKCELYASEDQCKAALGDDFISEDDGCECDYDDKECEYEGSCGYSSNEESGAVIGGVEAAAAPTKAGDVGGKRKYCLNDGPESLQFIPAADSPINQDMLIAATPLAGRVTAYIVKRGQKRTNDGSCDTTANCPYVSASMGGKSSGNLRDKYEAPNGVCHVCVNPPSDPTYCATTFNCASPPPPSPPSPRPPPPPPPSPPPQPPRVSAADLAAAEERAAAAEAAATSGVEAAVEATSALPAWGLAVIIVVVILLLVICVVLCVMVRMEKAGKPVFSKMDIGGSV